LTGAKLINILKLAAFYFFFGYSYQILCHIYRNKAAYFIYLLNNYPFLANFARILPTNNYIIHLANFFCL